MDTNFHSRKPHPSQNNNMLFLNPRDWCWILPKHNNHTGISQCNYHGIFRTKAQRTISKINRQLPSTFLQFDSKRHLRVYTGQNSPSNKHLLDAKIDQSASRMHSTPKQSVNYSYKHQNQHFVSSVNNFTPAVKKIYL